MESRASSCKKRHFCLSIASSRLLFEQVAMLCRLVLTLQCQYNTFIQTFSHPFIHPFKHSFKHSSNIYAFMYVAKALFVVAPCAGCLRAFLLRWRLRGLCKLLMVQASQGRLSCSGNQKTY